MQYPFHRDFYHQVKESIKTYPVTVFLGPLRCGKTVCLNQLSDDLKHVRYFDFKTLSDDETLGVFDEVLESLGTNTETIFLFDDISYVKNIETELLKIAHAIEGKTEIKTRIVLAGSQIYAVETWVDRAFQEPVGKFKAGFLTYSEYIRYRNLPEPSAEMYEQYVQEAAMFHQIGSLHAYLSECLKETIIANGNTSDYLFLNDCYLVKEHTEYLVKVYEQLCGKESLKDLQMEPDARNQAVQLLKNWGLSEESQKGGTSE